MNALRADTLLKVIREDQERAAQRALQDHELELLRKETPQEAKGHVRLAQSLGLLLPRRKRVGSS